MNKYDDRYKYVVEDILSDLERLFEDNSLKFWLIGESLKRSGKQALFTLLRDGHVEVNEDYYNPNSTASIFFTHAYATEIGITFPMASADGYKFIRL